MSSLVCWRRLLFKLLSLVVILAFIFQTSTQVAALQPNPPDPQSSSVGVEGTLGSPPPTQSASISSPSNGQVFTANPITVTGICPKGLLVKVFSNNVFVGSVECPNGSFSLQIDLFNGLNDLVARVYDSLDQAGPDSSTVSVTLNSQFAQFGQQLTITSNYAKRGADPGQVLQWPLILNGGTAPYALSVDWGDGKPPEVLSESFDGNITINHTYSNAGLFVVTVRVTDANGQTAFLQVVGVANGAIAQNTASGNPNGTLVKTDVIWWPLFVMFPLILVAFWLGQRHELFSLRRQLERNEERQI